MSIEKSSQGTSKQIKNAEEENLTNEEKFLSSRREKLFKELSNEDRELVGKCNLNIVDSKGLEQMKGIIKGHNVNIERSFDQKKFRGFVDKYEIGSEQAEKIFQRYHDIAVYQDEASKSSYDDLGYDAGTEADKMKKKDTDNLVEQLLA